MTEEKKEDPTIEELSDDSRRDFFSKAVTAAGALAAAGLAGAMAAEVAGAEPAPDPQIRQTQKRTAKPAVKTAARPSEVVKNTPLKYQHLAQGHSFEMKGTQLSQVLAREGLIPNGASANEAVMSITLKWD